MESPTPTSPNQNKPTTQKRSFFSEVAEGVPATPLLPRVLAFMMDYILILAIFFFITTQIIYPVFHPGFAQASREFVEEMMQNPDQSFSEQMEQYVEFQLQHEDISNETGFLLAVLTWLYFGLSELLMRGTTLGKKTFKLSSLELKTLQQPSGRTILLRNCLKSLSVIVPLLLFANIIILFFTRMRLAGHDIVSKTCVTRNNFLATQDQTDPLD